MDVVKLLNKAIKKRGVSFVLCVSRWLLSCWRRSLNRQQGAVSMWSYWWVTTCRKKVPSVHFPSLPHHKLQDHHETKPVTNWLVELELTSWPSRNSFELREDVRVAGQKSCRLRGEHENSAVAVKAVTFLLWCGSTLHCTTVPLHSSDTDALNKTKKCGATFIESLQL